jgi:hypothetical protein
MELLLAIAPITTTIVVFLIGVVMLISVIHTKKKISEIHVLVNSRMSDMEGRVSQLIGALDAANVKVPPTRDRDRT